MDGDPASVLQVEGLSYKYGRMEVWTEVDFQIEPGEIAFLVGQNGTGKSTLLRCLAGLAYPEAGRISLLEESFSGKVREQRSKISFVSDAPSFYDDMTAEEHIRFILQANHKGYEYAQTKELLESFTLKRYLGQYPSSYSRGMREKLALVIAFTVRPALYLFDEPYGPLDRKASGILSSEIKTRVSEGASVILSCHHPIPDLRPDKVLLLDEGNLTTESISILDGIWPIDANRYESSDEYTS